MNVHNTKPLPERSGIDYYSRYALILFCEDLIWLLDHNLGILKALESIGRRKENTEYEDEDTEDDEYVEYEEDPEEEYTGNEEEPEWKVFIKENNNIDYTHEEFGNRRM